ncbi:MAG TPA: CBS domain-containing protein [Kofleriaceae bacterium]|nr:CBS domain-containing protein [Kofleriaceae bacterium]
MNVTADTSTGMNMLAVASVGDLATRACSKVTADAPMGKVVDEMKSHGRGCVLVVDGSALVGIFTERDVLNRIDHSDAAWPQVAVGAIMTPSPIVVRPDDSLAEAIRRLTAGHHRHLPVVDERGIRGVISIRDILAYIAARFPEEMMNLPPDPTHES